MAEYLRVPLSALRKRVVLPFVVYIVSFESEIIVQTNVVAAGIIVGGEGLIFYREDY